jgi:serine/threonine protein kinase
MAETGADISEREQGSINVFGVPLSRWWIDGNKIPLDLPEYYNVFAVLGQGAYGCVVAASTEARDGSERETVAIKKFFESFTHSIHARRTLRELRFLRCLQHENIVAIRTVFCSGPSRDRLDEIYVATEVMDTDLYTVIRACQPFSFSHCVFFLYQILRGLKYIHSAGIIHRDLKPKNLLVNKSCDLRICDFGMARLENSVGDKGASFADQQMTEYVCTRWYRAPELLCCWTAYTTKVDIWSCGCILAEMLSRQCLFKGKSTMDQLRRIQNVLGKPSAEEIDKIPNAKARVYLHQQKAVVAPPIEQTLGVRVPKDAESILFLMLSFDPDKRQTCVELLNHEYLAQLHEEADEPTRQHVPMELFEFERRKVTAADLEEELFREMLEYHQDHMEPYLRTSSYDISALPLVVPNNAVVPAEEDIEEERNEDSDQEANEKMTIATNKTTGVQLVATP